jgi:hypothetical protein
VTDRERKRQLKTAFKEAQRSAELEACPVDPAELGELIEAVSRPVHDERGRVLCDRTLRLTRRCLGARGGRDVKAIIAFLHSKGGHCDCCMVANLRSWLGWNVRETRH